MTRCPSDLTLEVYLLDSDKGPVDAHLEGCAHCRERLAHMRAEGEEFRQYVFPATVEAVERAAEKRRFRWSFVFAPAGALAVATAALVLFIGTPGGPSGPPKDYEYGVKGSGMGLAVFVNGASGAQAVADGATVPASAALRFKVQPEHDCWLWILSVDASGAVSRLYPPTGAAPEKRAAGEVPGGAVLDGKGGPERIFAVCAPDERIAWPEVERAAQVAVGGAAKVRAAKALGGPLSKATQATLLLEKRP